MDTENIKSYSGPHRESSPAKPDVLRKDLAEFDISRRRAEQVLGAITERLSLHKVEIEALSAVAKESGTIVVSHLKMSIASAEDLFLQYSNGDKNTEDSPKLESPTERDELDATKSRLSRSRLGLNSVRHLPDWLETAIEHDGNGDRDAAIDIVFDSIDQLLTEHRFSDVDALFRQFPLEGPSLPLMMSLLSITLPAADRLPSREPFFLRLFRLCKAMGRDADKLLNGLSRWRNMHGTDLQVD